MPADPRHPHVAFGGDRLLAAGALADVAVAVRRAMAADPAAPVLVLDDHTGEPVDLDLRGDEDAVRARHTPPPPAPSCGPATPEHPPPPRGRGRPRLGVVAREVTLLPEHWDWLAAQPGGASVALRRLVHAARRAGAAQDRLRRARDRTYRAMSALAGDRPGFEDASRALFAGDRERLAAHLSTWPPDIRTHLLRLAEPGDDATDAAEFPSPPSPTETAPP